jgi:hypothetical protein
LEYIQQGLDEGYPLLKKVDDSRIFKTPTAIGNFLPVALKHVSLAELKEVIRPKYYGYFRDKAKGDYVWGTCGVGDIYI